MSAPLELFYYVLNHFVSINEIIISISVVCSALECLHGNKKCFVLKEKTLSFPGIIWEVSENFLN